MIKLIVVVILCFQGPEDVGALKAERALRDALPSLQRSDLEKWSKSLLVRGFVAADESVRNDCLKLLPNDVMARWIAGRLGVEFGSADGKELASKCQAINAAVAAADALTGGVYSAIPTYGRITLVVVDPPFGLDKGQWDKPKLAWTKDQFVQFLGFVCGAPATSKDGFCVAVYTTEERLPELEAVFAEAGRSAFKGTLVNGTLYKGCLKYIFVNDGTPGLFAGQWAGGLASMCVLASSGMQNPRRRRTT